MAAETAREGARTLKTTFAWQPPLSEGAAGPSGLLPGQPRHLRGYTAHGNPIAAPLFPPLPPCAPVGRRTPAAAPGRRKGGRPAGARRRSRAPRPGHHQTCQGAACPPRVQLCMPGAAALVATPCTAPPPKKTRCCCAAWPAPAPVTVDCNKLGPSLCSSRARRPAHSGSGGSQGKPSRSPGPSHTPGGVARSTLCRSVRATVTPRCTARALTSRTCAARSRKPRLHTWPGQPAPSRPRGALQGPAGTASSRPAASSGRTRRRAPRAASRAPSPALRRRACVHTDTPTRTHARTRVLAGSAGARRQVHLESLLDLAPPDQPPVLLHAPRQRHLLPLLGAHLPGWGRA